MKKLLAVILISSSLPSFAQESYWQQKTDYKIEVTLDDTLNALFGFVTIDYQNNSPQTLDFVYFHLWPNAYRDHTTPLAKQLLENGKTKFYFSKLSQRGFIDKLDFKANAEVCKWDYDSLGLEICKVILNKPLRKGETVHISTPFRVKLPETFSRMGHVGQSYQITQWYPKPAVFDKYGWHPIPYLDQGEFYSEFGSFDVSITLPKNYIVGATGDLQNVEEQKWLDSLSDATKKISIFENGGDLRFPVSSKEPKTLHYKQNNIHDFGWFADKRFHVLKGEVELPVSKRKVTTYALFTNNQAKYWSKASEYLHDAIYYYSLWVGEYPYNQVTAVDGTISAGGGMEYPNVTIIDQVRDGFSLDDVITHEVGHNWFYGMLGTNERDHAWMDEGINSYYEFRYLQKKYPERKMIPGYKESTLKTFDLVQYKHKYLMDLGYQVMARENSDQPIEQTSSKFTEFNYGVIVYGKTMLIFDYLEAYLGTEVFDKVMKKYFETWKYRHPQPEDIRKIFETETGKNLNWFFDDLIKTTKKIDYKISGVKSSGQYAVEVKGVTINDVSGSRVKITNKSSCISPVNIAIMNKDSILKSFWVEGFKRDTTIFLTSFEGDRIKINPLLKIPEINRRNNTYKLNKLAHKFEKLRFQFIGSIENPNRTQVFWAPYLGWNNYDKTQVGLVFYSPFIPSRKFEYLLAPVFGTGSKNIIGFTRWNYNFYPEKIQSITFGVRGKRFSYLLFPKDLTFNKIEPYLHFEFKKKNARSPFTHSLHLRSTNMLLQVIKNYDSGPKTTQFYFVNEIRYRFEQNSTINPLNAQITFRQGKDFGNISVEGNFLVSYKRKNEGFKIRLFAGGFLFNTKSTSDVTAPVPRFYLSNVSYNTYAYNLQKDYMFDENFVDRNGRDKYLGRQISKTDAAFRSLIPSFGWSDKFIAALNLTSTTHRFVPIQPFVNSAIVLNDLKKNDFAMEGGLSLVIIRDMIEIHLPLVTTKNISDNQKTYGITKWYQKFTFTLHWQMQKPVNLVRQLLGI